MTGKNLSTHSYLIAMLLLASAAASSATDKTHIRTAEQCGVDIEQPALKSFVNFNGTDGWREYKSPKDIPELVLGTGAAAFYWLGRNGYSLIAVQEPGEDFGAYTHYCFDRSGHLTRLRYELRTVWGWGFREEGLINKETLQVETSDFFDVTTEQSMRKPEMADEIPEALKPHLYLTKSTLPFSRLLPK